MVYARVLNYGRKIWYALLTGALLASSFSPTLAQSVSLELLYNWRNPGLAPSSSYSNTYNDCWGFVQAGVEYAVIGSSWGTHIFDLSDPENIVQVDSLQGEYSGAGVSHRDFVDYGGYLYAVCDQGSGISTLQIMDLRFLPDSVSVVYNSNELISLSHTIAIDTANARLYCFSVGFAPGFSSVAVLGLEDPANPVLLKIYNEGTQVHDGYIRDNIVYLNDGYNSRFLIVDWNDIDNPVVTGSLDSYPDQGYNHSGWLSDNQQTYVFTDENHGALLKVCDVSDPTDIRVLATFGSEVDPLSIAHNPVIRGDYVFTSYYHDGIYIHDLSDPANPAYVAHYKTYGADDHISYRGAWGVFPSLPSGLIIVSDMQYGLFVLRANGLALGQHSEPPALTITGISPNPFTDRIIVSIDSRFSGQGRIYLADLKGSIVEEQKLALTPGNNNLEWKLGKDLVAGLYIIRLETGNAVFSEQLVKFGPD